MIIVISKIFQISKIVVIVGKVEIEINFIIITFLIFIFDFLMEVSFISLSL
jgi:hypothetical protein